MPDQINVRAPWKGCFYYEQVPEIFSVRKLCKNELILVISVKNLFSEQIPSSLPICSQLLKIPLTEKFKFFAGLGAHP